MDSPTDEEPLPGPTDLEGWRRAAASGRFRAFRSEDIVAAIQDLGPNIQKAVLNPLVLHVSDTIVRILRHKIGRNYRNQGEDIITRAHGQLVVALFEPQSADGKGLRVAFVPRVQFARPTQYELSRRRKTAQSRQRARCTKMVNRGRSQSTRARSWTSEWTSTRS